MRLSLFFASDVHVGLWRDPWSIRFGANGGGACRALIALDDAGRVLGCLAFVMYSGRRLRSYLTFVDRRARGLGLGAALWALALDETRARGARVTVISDNGLALMRAVQAEHPRVRFLIREDGKRKLRDKRKGKA